MGILDGEDISLVVKAARQATRGAGSDSGNSIIDARVFDELMRVADVEHARFRKTVLDAEGHPFAILVRQARVPGRIVSRRFIDSKAEAELRLVGPLIVRADAVAPGVLPLKL